MAVKPCWLTILDWGGELPSIGHYLKAQRGRTAFLILDIKRAPPGARYVAKVRCERRSPAGLRADDVVWGWRWAKR